MSFLSQKNPLDKVILYTQIPLDVIQFSQKVILYTQGHIIYSKGHIIYSKDILYTQRSSF